MDYRVKLFVRAQRPNKTTDRQTYTRCSAGLLILQLLQYLLQRFFGIANAVAVLLFSIIIFIFISPICSI